MIIEFSGQRNKDNDIIIIGGNRMKNKFFHFIRYNLDIPYIFISIICIDILFRHFLQFKLIVPRAFLFTIFVAGIFAVIPFMLGKKSRTIYSCIILLIFAALNFAQVLHYEFFSTFFSFSKLSVIKEAFQVKGEISSKFDYKLLMFFLPFLVSLGLPFIRGRFFEIKSKLYRYVLPCLLALFFFSNCFITVITYPIQGISTESTKYLYDTLFNKVKAVHDIGLYSYTFKDIKMILFEGGTNTEKEREIVDNYLSNYGYLHEENEYTGIYEGKNLILILCESLTDVAIDEELTPTLFKLKTEGISFNNHYAPVYQSATADSEIISLTSIIPSINYGPTAYAFYENDFSDSLTTQLNDKGYSSNSFHSFHGDFYNRKTLHKNFGFNYFFAEEDLYFEKRDGWQNAFNWNLDKYLFQQVVSKTVDMDKYPFFDFVISVSGHIPYHPGRYELEGDLWATIQVKGDVGNPYSSEILCYFAAQRTLDQGLKQLVTDLEASGELDNTVIALYGDHYPYGLSNDGQKELYQYDKEYMINKVPFIIWTPNGESLEIDKVSSTFDIYPILANLFNIDLNGQFIVGNDILSNKDGLVIWENYSWLNDKAYYNSTTQTLDNFGNLSLEEVNSINERVQQTITAGQALLESNYFNNEPY